MKLGLSGRLTRATIQSPLTPLFLLAAIVFGIVALATIPREEEPQISVPMVDIFVTANGLKAPDAAELVTKPLEEIVKGIPGVEHVYSQTQDDRVLVTARFRRSDPARAGQAPRQLRQAATGHPRTADRRTRHQRCGGSGTDPVTEAGRGVALE
jgi:multidrug efflux pump subunit AcrB